MERGLEDGLGGRGGHALVLNKLCLRYNYVNFLLRLPLWEINPRLPACETSEFGLSSSSLVSYSKKSV